MRNLFKNLILITLLVIGIWSLVICSARADDSIQFQFYPAYAIMGSIKSEDGTAVNGLKVVFYKSTEYLKEGIFVSGISGDGSYLLNPYAVLPPYSYFAEIGKEFYVYIPNNNLTDPKNGYGADPVKVTMSGSGVDYADLVFKKGGASSPEIIAKKAPPLIDNLKFGNRLYQRAMVERGDKFIVSSTTKISANVSSEYGIDAASGLSISIKNEKSAETKELNVSTTYMSNTIKVKGEGSESYIGQLSFAYQLEKENELQEGENIVTIKAKDASGTATEESAKVTVMSGPLSIIGPALTYPSPFSPTKDKTVFIVYTMNTDGAVDILMVSAAKQVVKKIVCESGTEGGSAGINKVQWNGKTDMGPIVGNGIYSGAIIDRAKGKVIGRFKLSVVD